MCAWTALFWTAVCAIVVAILMYIQFYKNANRRPMLQKEDGKKDFDSETMKLKHDAEKHNEIEFTTSVSPSPTKSSCLGERSITPIREISIGCTDWTINGKCTQLKPVKIVNNKGPCKVLNFDVKDKDGSSIHLAAFRELVVKYESVIKFGCWYYITGGKIYKANKTYDHSGHDYSIVINENTTIIPCEENIPKPELNACPLNAINDHLEEAVDILAVVTKVGPIETFKRKRDDAEMINRSVTLIDRTETPVAFKVWFDYAKNFPEDAVNKVIEIKRAKVELYDKEVHLNCDKGTKCKLSPDHREAESLFKWNKEKCLL